MSDRLRPSSAPSTVQCAAELLEVLRAAPPLTHCITNAVVTGFTANVLLAVGAAPAMVDIVGEAGMFAGAASGLLVNLGTPAPAMVDIVGEAGMFAGAASGLLVNLGTPAPEQRAASLEAAEAATLAGTPWVLDPVAIGVLPVRTALAGDLAECRPTAIRGNASEILALAGMSAGGRGVDATDSTEAARDAARHLARRHGSVVAVSGAVDLLTDGERIVRLANGDPLLTRVTGGGCALGAVMAAFLGAARATDVGALDAVAAASLVYTIAAEDAAATATGPGSFAVALLDALAAIQPADVSARSRVEEATR